MEGNGKTASAIKALFADALFGLISQLIKEAGEETMQTPQDVRRLLVSRLQPHFASRGLIFQVSRKN